MAEWSKAAVLKTVKGSALPGFESLSLRDKKKELLFKMNQPIKILIVDDHALVRTGIKYILHDVEGILVIGEASSGEDAIKLTRELNPDVILMDVQMPGIGGLGATRKLLRISPEIKILIVTVCDDDLFPSKLIQAGAFGYITKGSSRKEMIKAIHTIYTGQRYLSPEIASQLAMKHLTDEKKKPLELLSERELQISMMITNGIKVPQISKKLCLSNKTVNSYRYRIFEKLKINSDVELTHFAIRNGLVEDFYPQAILEED
jgi:two-component system, NarL family, invasion response regulator UvrY